MMGKERGRFRPLFCFNTTANNSHNVYYVKWIRKLKTLKKTLLLLVGGEAFKRSAVCWVGKMPA